MHWGTPGLRLGTTVLDHSFLQQSFIQLTHPTDVDKFIELHK
uniref:Uncharacterized protein n=1 Tax=Anguilla anguilla TaxID=7936 RepID=A0A0E9XGI1_ANGAN